MIILNHITKCLFIEWDDGWNTDFFTLPVIGFASTNLNFKSVFVRFGRNFANDQSLFYFNMTEAF